jgi:hypothetical protein
MASAGTEIERFDRDDEGYIRWVTVNPDGFVLNLPRPRGRSGLMLHRAGCPTITGEPTRGQSWTADYVKLCSGEKWRLDDWATQELGARPPRCQICSPD